MKPGILLTALVLGVASSRAQTIQDEVAVREKKRLAEVALATDQVNKSYLKDYEVLLQRANIVGDAQGANLVRAMIRRMNPEPEATADKKPAADPTAALINNHWLDEDVEENGHHHFFPTEFHAGGEVVNKKARVSGTWKIVNNVLVIEYPLTSERFPLPVRLDKWPGKEINGTPRYLDVDKSAGDVSAPAGTSAASSGASPTASPGRAGDYFGKP